LDEEWQTHPRDYTVFIMANSQAKSELACQGSWNSFYARVEALASLF
jgi:hypothetical protein